MKALITFLFFMGTAFSAGLAPAIMVFGGMYLLDRHFAQQAHIMRSLREQNAKKHRD